MAAIVATAIAAYFAVALGLIVSARPGKLAAEGGLDFTGLVRGGAGDPAPLQSYLARDGSRLDYRAYACGRDNAPLMVFVHGSGWHGLAYDGLARAIAASGAADVLLPDLRGHGENPQRRGDVDYIGQLEDDLADLIQLAVKPGKKLVVAGHSSGGGLAIRYAGSANGQAVDGAILLAPYLHHSAPTMRENSGGWAHPLIRRIVGLTMLNFVGIRALNGLPVIQFAFPRSVLDGPLGKTATDRYSFRMNTSYAPRNDYKADIAALPPFLLVAGEMDEAFVAERYQTAISSVNPNGSYVLIPGVSHLGVIDDKATVEAMRAFLSRLESNNK
jgi:pimeloyl-ACP methyl ester carboxylesterase